MEEHKIENAKEAEDDLSDLTMALGSQLDVSLIPNNPCLPHPQYTEGKGRKRPLGEQDERRKEMLKRRRTEVESCPVVTSMFTDIAKGEGGGAQLKKIYTDLLMLSEWLVDIPDDLAVNWVVKLCPEGRHVLLVASNGRTSMYTKSGHQIATFPSYLPGGNRDLPGRFTMLDCIWNATNKTYYVLDVLEWNCQSMVHCDTTFRFYWLQSKFEELKELQSKSKKNTYPLHVIPSFECTPEMLTDAMSKFPYYEGGLGVDGVLFYHKASGYTSGITPLVTWLKPFMVQDLLEIPIAEGYNKERPPGYESQKCYIEHDGQRKGRSHFPRQAKGKHQSRGKKMEVNSDEIETEISCEAADQN